MGPQKTSCPTALGVYPKPSMIGGIIQGPLLLLCMSWTILNAVYELIIQILYKHMLLFIWKIMIQSGTILHMPQKLCCRDMYKTASWLID